MRQSSAAFEGCQKLPTKPGVHPAQNEAYNRLILGVICANMKSPAVATSNDMTPTRPSMLLIRSSFVALLIVASVLPYHAAHWLVQHHAVYYSLGSSGRLGLFITNTAEMINIVSSVPFVALGLVVGFILAFTLPRFHAAKTIES